MDNQQAIFKLMLLGDVSTGKTSFITQLMYRSAERLPKPTTNLSFFTMRISKPPTVVQIWDSSGDQKYSYQAVGSLKNFRAVLIFIDITNEYTFHRACMVAQRLQVYKNLMVHIVQSKVQVCQKDKFKRKVSKSMIKKLSDRFQGGIFYYRLNESVQLIIQSIVQWKKDNREKLLQKYINQTQLDTVPLPEFQKQQLDPTCTCVIC